jgi:hypothetical protein
MFNKNNISKYKSIRFCKWSRKPYAVFLGLKLNVTIGHLAKGIVEALLPKTNTLEIIVPNGTHLSLQKKSMDEVLSQAPC